MKVARPEHLIIMSLRAWRPDPDYSRVAALYNKADKALVKSLLGRFDDKNRTLRSRLDWITATAYKKRLCRVLPTRRSMPLRRV